MASAEVPRSRQNEQEQRQEPNPRSIRQLPDVVVAQIKSSIAINNLTDVTLELIKNSLDAKATKVVVSIDFRRASCTVEDNGLGILSSEFAVAGGLGKLYHTSKYPGNSDAFGQHGSFLASLASLSLLTIASRHHQHQSVNSLVFHNSKCISRSTPLRAPTAPILGQHGTTVSVRDLFGNMPVRVKQRAALAERTELDKVCNGLKREAVAILLAYGKPTELNIQHIDVGPILRLRKRSSADNLTSTSAWEGSHHSGTSAMIQHSLRTLFDAFMLSNEDRRDWIPVSASTEIVRVKGAISLNPAPNKNIQFVSLDRRPLTQMSGHNELFGEVNRIFSNSSFGAFEKVQKFDDPQQDRRTSSRSFDLEAPTIKDLKGALKGVDRWPMFFFHITSIEANESLPGRLDFVTEPMLPAIIDVLSATVTQWLTSQNYQPRKRQKPERPSSSNSASSALNKGHTLSSFSEPARPFSRAVSTGEKPELQRSYNSTRPLVELSRIRSAKPSFYNSAWSSSLPIHALNPYITSSRRAPVIEDHSSSTSIVAVEQHESSVSTTVINDGTKLRIGDECSKDESDAVANDTFIVWQDPVSTERCLISRRTGTMLPLRSVGVPTDGKSASESSDPLQPVTLRHRTSAQSRSINQTQSETEHPSTSGWLDSFLDAWENPVFSVQEQRIPQITLETPQSSSLSSFGILKTRSNACHPLHYEQIAADSKVKFSRDGLLRAGVVAQVDSKFILISLPSTQLKHTTEKDVLVLVDQHAADERIKVESLLRELCTPPDVLQSRYRSKGGQAPGFKYMLLAKPMAYKVSDEELVLFNRYAAYFARWSILYDVTDVTVLVTTLPSVVAERLKSSPQLLIDLLRSEIHALDQDHRPATRLASQADNTSSDQPSWLKLINDCPPGLLDLVNSRACRSAIMFNDVLDMRECQDLIDGLARCIFPFICAHGRPSMVPIVTFGAGMVTATSAASQVDGSSFVDAFRRWQAVENDQLD